MPQNGPSSDDPFVGFPTIRFYFLASSLRTSASLKQRGGEACRSSRELTFTQTRSYHPLPCQSARPLRVIFINIPTQGNSSAEYINRVNQLFAETAFCAKLHLSLYPRTRPCPLSPFLTSAPRPSLSACCWLLHLKKVSSTATPWTVQTSSAMMASIT
jgi:hypothetical protein